MTQNYIDPRTGESHTFPDDATPQEIDAATQPKSFLSSLKDAAMTRKQPSDSLFGGLVRAGGNFDVARGTKTPEEAEANIKPYTQTINTAAGQAVGGGLGTAMKAGRLAPAVGRVLGSAAGAGVGTPEGDDSRVGNMLRAAATTAGLEGLGAALPAVLGKVGSFFSQKPTVNVVTHDLTWPKVPIEGGGNRIISATPDTVSQIIHGYPLPVAGPVQVPAPAGDVIRKIGTTTSVTPPRVSVPPIPAGAQGAIDAAGNTPTGQGVTGIGGLLLLQNLLKKIGIAPTEMQGAQTGGRANQGGGG